MTNASLTLKLLADSDQSSFGALQQEVDVLESQLSECERQKEKEQASRRLDHPSPRFHPENFVPVFWKIVLFYCKDLDPEICPRSPAGPG